MTEPLRVDAIRPKETLEGQQDALEEDMAWFAERRKHFIRCPCPACGLTEAVFQWTRDGMRFQRCPQCQTYYVDPRPGVEWLHLFLLQSARYKHFCEVIFPASVEARREAVYVPRIHNLIALTQKWEVPRRSLLEIGAGYGTFAAMAKALFECVTVVEPMPDLAAHCRKQGLEVIAETMFENTSLCGANVIAAFEVLEHTAWPWTFLRTCMQTLEPGGLLVLTCPNGLGFDVQVLGKESSVFALGHLNLFNPDALTHLLERANFHVLEIATPGKLDVDIVREAALAGNFNLDQHPFLRRILIDGWSRLAGRFQQFLADNRLSSHMWAVARKPKGETHVKP